MNTKEHELKIEGCAGPRPDFVLGPGKGSLVIYNITVPGAPPEQTALKRVYVAKPTPAGGGPKHELLHLASFGMS